MAFEDSTDLTEPFFTIAPENFRRVIQRQISTHVGREIDGLTQFDNSTNDGRYAGTKPTETIYMSNAHGFHYFVVGASVVGAGAVAAP